MQWMMKRLFHEHSMTCRVIKKFAKMFLDFFISELLPHSTHTHISVYAIALSNSHHEWNFYRVWLPQYYVIKFIQYEKQIWFFSLWLCSLLMHNMKGKWNSKCVFKLSDWDGWTWFIYMAHYFVLMKFTFGIYRLSCRVWQFKTITLQLFYSFHWS